MHNQKIVSLGSVSIPTTGHQEWKTWPVLTGIQSSWQNLPTPLKTGIKVVSSGLVAGVATNLVFLTMEQNLAVDSMNKLVLSPGISIIEAYQTALQNLQAQAEIAIYLTSIGSGILTGFAGKIKRSFSSATAKFWALFSKMTAPPPQVEQATFKAIEKGLVSKDRDNDFRLNKFNYPRAIDQMFIETRYNPNDVLAYGLAVAVKVALGAKVEEKGGALALSKIPVTPKNIIDRISKLSIQSKDNTADKVVCLGVFGEPNHYHDTLIKYLSQKNTSDPDTQATMKDKTILIHECASNTVTLSINGFDTTCVTLSDDLVSIASIKKLDEVGKTKEILFQEKRSQTSTLPPISLTALAQLASKIPTKNISDVTWLRDKLADNSFCIIKKNDGTKQSTIFDSKNNAVLEEINGENNLGPLFSKMGIDDIATILTDTTSFTREDIKALMYVIATFGKLSKEVDTERSDLLKEYGVKNKNLLTKEREAQALLFAHYLGGLNPTDYGMSNLTQMPVGELVKAYIKMLIKGDNLASFDTIGKFYEAIAAEEKNAVVSTPVQSTVDASKQQPEAPAPVVALVATVSNPITKRTVKRKPATTTPVQPTVDASQQQPEAPAPVVAPVATVKTPITKRTVKRKPATTTPVQLTVDAQQQQPEAQAAVVAPVATVKTPKKKRVVKKEPATTTSVQQSVAEQPQQQVESEGVTPSPAATKKTNKRKSAATPKTGK